MTIQFDIKTPGKVDTSISRRGFLAGSCGLTFAFAFTGGFLGRPSESLAADGAKLNAWVTVAGDDTITILCPSSEMGQGVLTALPLILAEELDADWSKVKCEFAPGNPALYGSGHKMFKGAQVTLASVSVPGYYTPLRIAGAQARRVLLDNAAKQWGVPVGELSTEPSVVVHKASGRRVSYGEIARTATVPAQAPGHLRGRSEAAVAVPADRPQGHRPRRRALQGRRHGPLRHRRPGARHGLCGAAARAMDGVKAQSINADAVKAIKGVTHVLPLPFGVAVVGDTVEATRKGRDLLQVKWDTAAAKAASFDSEKAKEEYARKARDPNAEVKDAFKNGDADGALGRRQAGARSGLLVRAHLSRPDGTDERRGERVRRRPVGRDLGRHPGATARGRGRRRRAQGRRRTRSRSICSSWAAASAGASGRDAPVQAAVLSSIIKKPVKLMLTREDDLAAARPAADDPPRHQGRPRRGQEAGRLASPPRRRERRCGGGARRVSRPAAGGDYVGWVGMEQTFYAIPNFKADAIREQRGMRVHAWRGHRHRLQQVRVRELPRRDRRRPGGRSSRHSARSHQGSSPRPRR